MNYEDAFDMVLEDSVSNLERINAIGLVEDACRFAQKGEEIITFLLSQFDEEKSSKLLEEIYNKWEMEF